MATVFLSIPSKQTGEVNLAKPLKQFVQDTYGANGDFTGQLEELNKLRASAVSKFLDKHEAALEVLYRYHDQLASIEAKIPIAENVNRINFKWLDAFDKGSFFVGKLHLTLSSAAYERVCLLFNIAALSSQIAETQNYDSDEGLKKGAKLLQQAAGIFDHLKTCVIGLINQEPTPDIAPETLGTLSVLMLAQAQEAIFRKTVRDSMRDANVAKVANQGSDFYADALRLLQVDSMKDYWPKAWVTVVAGKQAYMHAMAEYYQAKAVGAGGEQLSRLQKAQELIQKANQRGEKGIQFPEALQRITADFAQVKKDNDLIYHERVPDHRTLEAIGKAVLAKPIPPAKPMSTNFKDLFENLHPLAVQHAIQAFEAKKSEVVNMEIGRLRESTQMLNGVLASMNLPAALEDTSGHSVPTSLIEKTQAMQQLGGIASLDTLMSELPALLKRNKEILDETVRLMDEEGRSDRELKQQFGDRWTRTPSERLTEPLRAEAAKYSTIIETAINADGVVKQKYNEHRQGIEILSRGNVAEALPNAGPDAQLQGNPVVNELRGLMEQVDAIKAEREVFEFELQGVKTDSLSTDFLSVLASVGVIGPEVLDSNVERLYGSLQVQLRDNLTRQDQLLHQIQTANTKFCMAKNSNDGASRREAVMKQLAAAFDAYNELKENLTEGTRFYNDLTPLLAKFQQKVSDFCFARKTEKDDVMHELQSRIANQPSPPVPNQPSYQKPQGPPPRPPAPAVPQQPPQQPQQQHQQFPPQQQQQFQPQQAGQFQQQPPQYQQPTSFTPQGAPSAPYPSYNPYQPMTPPALPTGFNPYMSMYRPPGVAPQQPYPPQQLPGYPGYPGYNNAPGYPPPR